MPAMEPIGWKRQAMILAALTISWDHRTKQPRQDSIFRDGVTVPVGFIHNGPSIPDRLRGIVFYTHRLLRPSIVHDYLYTYGYKTGWTRKEADRLFLESLKAEGVGRIRRRVMWLSVRVAGWTAWSTSAQE